MNELHKKNTTKIFHSFAMSYALSAFLLLIYVSIGPTYDVLITGNIQEETNLAFIFLVSLILPLIFFVTPIILIPSGLYIVPIVFYLVLVTYLVNILESFFEVKVLMPLIMAWCIYGVYCFVILVQSA